jgi:putative alpha-1,2-mannosidase
MTQGGSNSDVLIADAWMKGLKGIDYELALQAMIKNAEVPPGGNEDKKGRGGLPEYSTIGYVTLKTPRAGSRTMENAFNDYCSGPRTGQK